MLREAYGLDSGSSARSSAAAEEKEKSTGGGDSGVLSIPAVVLFFSLTKRNL